MKLIPLTIQEANYVLSRKTMRKKVAERMDLLKEFISLNKRIAEVEGLSPTIAPISHFYGLKQALACIRQAEPESKVINGISIIRRKEKIFLYNAKGEL